jgi:hypothetical protein
MQQIAKANADNLEKISVQDFTKNTPNSGSFSFSTGFTANFDILHDSRRQEGIILSYKDAFHKAHDIQQYIPFVKTRCHFGGYRYWFSCPAEDHRFRCDKRVGTLYLLNGFFACRHCHALTYSLRNYSRKSSHYYMLKEVRLRDRIDNLRMGLKRTRYDGKPTKKLVALSELYTEYKEITERNDLFVNAFSPKDEGVPPL